MVASPVTLIVFVKQTTQFSVCRKRTTLILPKCLKFFNCAICRAIVSEIFQLRLTEITRIHLISLYCILVCRGDLSVGIKNLVYTARVCLSKHTLY